MNHNQGIDFDKGSKRRISWAVEEYMEVHEYAMGESLGELRFRNLVESRGRTGDVTHIEMNNLASENQLCHHGKGEGSCFIPSTLCSIFLARFAIHNCYVGNRADPGPKVVEAIAFIE